MVELRNIAKKGNIISCNYVPENSDLEGYIEVDIKTQAIKAVEYSEYEYGKKMYAGQVRAKLCELLHNSDELPKTAFAVWF